MYIVSSTEILFGASSETNLSYTGFSIALLYTSNDALIKRLKVTCAILWKEITNYSNMTYLKDEQGTGQ
ncbi:hypothetical protein T4D_9102 [Trichinella pseudospiralis]|uniref:Uncharacterized protein n=1 Tax=Trichinella pseudospiralis TaxID=6337 RepID=A0A0V1F830_TRIPS|nr:hypothetical protein T4D_9102 [Trichinella pseudospiralis]